MFRHKLSCSVLAFIAAAQPAFAADPAIRVVAGKDDKPAAVEAIGLSQEVLARLSKLPADDESLAHMLALYLVTEGRTQLPAMAGKYEIVGDALRFTPRFALRPGLKYQAHFFPPPPGPQSSPARLEKEISIPAPPPAEPTKVAAIFPSAAVLPENQLRFYVHFSAPMRKDEAFSHIKLLGPSGKADELAFFDVGEELWDASGQRLTVLFHPGRTKRGLKPREEFGPVLLPGQKYTLAIDKSWRDAAGRPLAANFEKHFTAGPLIEAALDHKQWKVTTPKASSQEPLVVRFPHALDRALLDWTIVVQDAAGKPLVGDVTVAEDERRWEFRPEMPWTAGQHALVIDTRLEDTAGNNLARPFEVDVFRTVDKGVAPEFVRLPFEIGPK